MHDACIAFEAKCGLEPFSGYSTLFARLYTSLLILLLALIPLGLQANELKRPMQGVRNLGMGNVGVALSYDENALFYNPAGLAAVDTVLVGLPTLYEVSQDTIDIASDISKLGSDSSTADTFQLVLGKDIFFRTSPIGMNLVIPFGSAFTLGAALTTELRFELAARNPVSLELAFGSRLDAIGIFGFGTTINKGQWLVGASYNQIRRNDIPRATVSLGDALDTDTLEDTVGLSSTLSSASSYDIGFQRRLASFSSLQMTWGAVAHNLGRLTFDRADNETNPADVATEYDLGLSIQPDWGSVRLLGAIDFRDITIASEDDPYCRSNRGTDCTWKRLHMGLELGLFPIDTSTNVVSLRAGYNQGYFSFGFGLAPLIFTRFLNIDYAVYKAEIGSRPGSPQLRRALQIQFGF